MTDDNEVKMHSRHNKPPLWLLVIWLAFFIYLFTYLIRYAWPDLQSWISR